MADLVHRHVEPGAPELALAPVERSVHDRGAAADARHALHGQRRIGHPDVARRHRETVGIRFHEPNAAIAAEQFEDLAGTLFLGLGDRVLLRHAVE